MYKLKTHLNKYLGIFLVTGAVVVAVGTSAVQAASSTPTVSDLGGDVIENELILGNASPEELTISIINWILAILALIAVIMILIGGFKWLTAGGNEEKVEGAKKLLIAAIIGLLVILSAWGISVYVINNLLEFTQAG